LEVELEQPRSLRVVEQGLEAAPRILVNGPTFVESLRIGLAVHGRCASPELNYRVPDRLSLSGCQLQFRLDIGPRE
jgi:hypothetical protein